MVNENDKSSDEIEFKIMFKDLQESIDTLAKKEVKSLPMSQFITRVKLYAGTLDEQSRLTILLMIRSYLCMDGERMQYSQTIEKLLHYCTLFMKTLDLDTYFIQQEEIDRIFAPNKTYDFKWDTTEKGLTLTLTEDKDEIAKV